MGYIYIDKFPIQKQMLLKDHSVEYSLDEDTTDDALDPFKTVRRFLYGRDALKRAENREAMVLSSFRGRDRWPYSAATLDSCVGYLKARHYYDSRYTEERNEFYAKLICL